MSEFLRRLQNALPKPVLFGLYGAVGGLLGALLLGELSWWLLSPPATFNVNTSSSMTMDQGATGELEVELQRYGFDGPAEVEFKDVPEGVTISAAGFSAKSSRTTVEVKATANAKIGEHKVKVVGRATDKSKLSSEAELTLKIEDGKVLKIDVFFVLDVTGSMQDAIDGMRDGIREFADTLSNEEFDGRYGLIAYRDRLEGEEPQILRFGNGEPFTADENEFKSQVARLAALGGGDFPESALDALKAASEQPFRPNAARVLVLVTDAPPLLPDRDVRSPDEVIDAFKQHGIAQLHLVVNQDQYGAFYKPLRDGLGKGDAGGRFIEFRSAARNSASFAAIMPDLGRDIAKLASADRLTKSAAVKAVQSDRAYDPRQKWRLLTALALWTAIITAAICWLIVFGQQYYLKQSFPGSSATLLAVGGGLASGLVGGALAQLLFSLAQGWFPQAPNITQFVTRPIGWAVLGTIAGGGLAFLIPNLRPEKGMMGGAVGGVAGAIGFIVAAMVLNAIGVGEIPARVLGAALVGFFIGLMVALAEKAFRQAWIEVWYGPRESRVVNLGPEPVSLGSDARSCTVYARNAAPIAAKFKFQQQKVFFDDVTTGQSVEVSPGFRRQIGNVEVVVHTSAAPAAAAMGGSLPSTSTRVPPPPPSRGAAPPPPPPQSQMPPPPAAPAPAVYTAAPAVPVYSPAPLEPAVPVYQAPPAPQPVSPPPPTVTSPRSLPPQPVPPRAPAKSQLPAPPPPPPPPPRR